MSEAALIAKALKGKKAGSGWLCLCPAHDDRSPSLSIADGADGRLLVKCHAGCDPLAVLTELRRRGLAERDPAPLSPEQQAAIARKEREEIERRKRAARRLWGASRPAAGTVVETYLRQRGYDGPIPPTLRHHPDLKHDNTGLAFPGMVAAVTVWPSRDVAAVHRTFLKPDGSGKAPVSPDKKMLGPVKGGAVRLAAASPTMAVTEGIETGLSVQLASGLPTWAALSAGGIESLILPPLAREVVICADHDERGQAAAERAARRWHAEGRKVRIALPPAAGQDFNDLLRGVA